MASSIAPVADAASSIWINRDDSSIAMGTGGDVELKRTGDGELRVTANTTVRGDIGTYRCEVGCVFVFALLLGLRIGIGIGIGRR